MGVLRVDFAFDFADGHAVTNEHPVAGTGVMNELQGGVAERAADPHFTKAHSVFLKEVDDFGVE
jgi:hypothetical protein